MTDKKIKKSGFFEEKDLSCKSKIHSINARKTQFKKEKIQKEVSITPGVNKRGEKNLNLRFKDSDKLADAISEFEKKYSITIFFDFEKDSFIVAVSKDMGDMFRIFMREEGLEEIPETREIARSKSARSITAQKIRNKENLGDLKAWAAHPNHSYLENIDTATEEKTISDRVEQQ